MKINNNENKIIMINNEIIIIWEKIIMIIEMKIIEIMKMAWNKMNIIKV